MPLFGRKKAEPQVDPVTATPIAAPEPVVLAGPTGELACDHPYCNRHDGVQCVYRDRRESTCKTQWCPDHYQLIGGAPYCRRHVAIARALARHTATHAVAPDIDNRAPSLCEWVASAIEERVVGALGAASSGHPGSRMLTEELELVLEGTPRMRYWERSWKLVDHTGPLAKVAIRVSENNDSEVMAIVGRETLAAVVPPWVDRSATDDASREGFYVGLVHTLSRGLNDYLNTNRAAGQGILPAGP